MTYDDPTMDVVIDDPDEYADIRRARSVRVIRADIVDAVHAQIEGDLDADGATVADGIYADGAKIGGRIKAKGATIGGIKIGPITAAEKTLLLKIRKSIRLDMEGWHGGGREWCKKHRGHCGTTHCLAGGAQALSRDPKIRAMDPYCAGSKLLPNASYLFFAPQDIVERYLDDLARTAGQSNRKR